MSSACTCHIDVDTCWWCLYEIEKEKAERYEKALDLIVRGEKPTATAKEALGLPLERDGVDGWK